MSEETTDELCRLLIGHIEVHERVMRVAECGSEKIFVMREEGWLLAVAVDAKAVSGSRPMHHGLRGVGRFDGRECAIASIFGIAGRRCSRPGRSLGGAEFGSLFD